MWPSVNGTHCLHVADKIGQAYNQYKEKEFPKHYSLRHGCNCEGTTFLGINKFTSHWRLSNTVREISRLEIRWIYQTQTYAPFRMNIDWDINSFINNSSHDDIVL